MRQARQPPVPFRASFVLFVVKNAPLKKPARTGEAGRRMGIPQTKVSGHDAGDFANLSECKLMEWLRRLPRCSSQKGFPCPKTPSPQRPCSSMKADVAYCML
jgi:hypothetical protein